MATGTNKEQRQHPPAPTGHLPWSKAFQLYSEPSTSVPSREECDLFISEGRADGYPQLEEIERWQSSRAEPDRHFHTDRARWQQAEPANVTSARSCSATFIPSWPADASNSGDFPDDMAVEGLNSAALDLLSTWDNQQSAISKQAGSTSMALQPSNAARLKLSSTASTATAEEATCSFEDFHSSSQQYRQQQNPFVRADLDMPQRKQQATVLPTKQNSKVGVKPLKKLQPAKKITRPAQVIHAAAKKRQKTTKTHFVRLHIAVQH